MYEVRNGTVCVPAKLLYDGLDLIPFTTYINYVNRGNVKIVQKGGNGRKSLLDFRSLPEQLKTAIVDKIGEPPEKEPIITRIEHFYEEDMRARAFFEEYTLPDGRHLEAEHQEEYTTNASMLAAIAAVVNETQLTRQSRGGSKAVNWKGIAFTVSSLKEKKDTEGNYLFKHTLPENERRLRNKLNDYKKNGYTSLISGKFMNKNTAKIDDEVKVALLQELLGDGGNNSKRDPHPPI